MPRCTRPPTAAPPLEVVERLIGLFAWRTLQNAWGERPVDVAEREGHRHLLGVLAPEHKHKVPLGVLLKLQAQFHAVIRVRAEREVDKHRAAAGARRAEMWLPVPRMYGGFSYRLEITASGPKLVSESWCRVVEGSGEMHEITPTGSPLLGEGFV